jgi:hypothetical protein
MADKWYVGSGKEKTFPNGGSITTVSLEIDEIEKIFQEYGFVSKTGKRYIRITVGRRREVGKYGETHTVEVDTWKPDQKAQSSSGGQGYQGYQKAAPKPSSGTAESYSEQFSDDPPDFPDDIPF